MDFLILKEDECCPYFHSCHVFSFQEGKGMVGTRGEQEPTKTGLIAEPLTKYLIEVVNMNFHQKEGNAPCTISLG